MLKNDIKSQSKNKPTYMCLFLFAPTGFERLSKQVFQHEVTYYEERKYPVCLQDFFAMF